MLRIEAAVLPAVDEAGERPRGPPLVVEVARLQELLQEPQLVVRVEDGEVGSEAHELGVHAQDLDADRMERAEPRHALVRAGEDAHPLAHLARRLVGEGDGQDLVGPRPAGGDQMGDAGRQHPCLADARAGENEHRPVERLDRGELLGVQPLEIGGKPRRRAMNALAWRERRESLGFGRIGGLSHGANHAPATSRAQPALSRPHVAAPSCGGKVGTGHRD